MNAEKRVRQVLRELGVKPIKKKVVKEIITEYVNTQIEIISDSKIKK